MYNPNDVPYTTVDDYLDPAPVHPLTWTLSSEVYKDITPPPATPQELAREMVDAILKNRGPDNGGDGGTVNHQPEALTSALYNACCAVLFNGDTDMSGTRVCIFHLCHGFSRTLIAALDGKMLWDKIVDHGGWAQVLADRRRIK
jgi:hypothetical protein